MDQEYKDLQEESSYTNKAIMYSLKSEQRYKKLRKKSRRRGILMGILIVLLPLALLVCGGAWFLRSRGLYITVTSDKALEITTKLGTIQSLIDEYYLFDYDQEELADTTIAGYVNGLGDPYSNYYSEAEYKKLQESNEGSYYGIGVMMSQDRETGIITATRVFSGSPALESGMQPGDILISVDGTEVTGTDLSTVVSMIKGAEGSTVRLEIGREGEQDVLVMDVERRQVSMDTVTYRMLEDKIGYIELIEFDSVTTDQFKNALDALKKEGMESLVVDLRNNPGGLLSVAVDLADIFIDQGTVITTEDSKGNTKDYAAEEEGALGIPCVFLVNENSASASEVLSGCLKYYNAITLVGQKTFGKGIVQNIIPLTDGTALKLTVAHYFLPDGADIHKKGITPDITVEDDPKTEADEQLDKGIAVLKGQD